MTRYASNNSNAIAWFPFLAVLLSTMGALLVVMAALTRHAGEQAAAATLHGSAGNSAPTDLTDLVGQLEEVRQYQERLRQLREEGESRLRDEQARLAHSEEHARRLEHELAQLTLAAEQLKATEQNQSVDREQAKAELERLQQLITDTESQLESLRGKEAGKRSYAVVPYQGRNGTMRKPIYIECTAKGIFLQPEGLRLEESDFIDPSWPGNPLAAALRATREYHNTKSVQAGEAEPPDPYPLILVRPDGIRNYLIARMAITSWDSDFGYEFVNADWKIDFPDMPDPLLARAQQHAVMIARERLARLVQAAPSQFRGVATGIGRGGSGSGGSARGVGSGGGDGSGGYGTGGDGDTSGDLAESYGGGSGMGDGLGTGTGSGVGGEGEMPAGGDGTGGGQTAAGGELQYGGMGGPASGGDYLGGSQGGPSGEGTGTGGYTSAGAAAGQTGSTAGDPQAGGQSGGGAPSYGQAGGGAAGATASSGTPGGSAASGTGSGGGGPQNGSIGFNSSGPPPQTGQSQTGQAQAGQSQSGQAHSAQSRMFPQASIAESRGSDWAVEKAMRNAIPVRRPIQVVVRKDQMALLPSRHASQGAEATGKVISLDQSADRIHDEFVAALKARVEEWGLAGNGLYWRPVLELHIGPDAQQTAAKLSHLLRDSGVELKLPDTAEAQQGGSVHAPR